MQILCWSCGLEVQAYHQPGALVEVDIKMVVELNNALFLQPLLGIGELANCAIEVELAGSQISSLGRR